MYTISIKSSHASDPGTIQSAIDSLPEGRLGRIILKKGIHYSDPLRLGSNLIFRIEKGAELRFTDDFSRYPAVFSRWEGTECHVLQPMIFAEECRNITLCGKGIIDGGGPKWWTSYRDMRKGILTDEMKDLTERFLELNRDVRGGSGGGGRESGFLRPPLIQFKDCSRIRLRGLTFRNSAFWNTHILYSRDVKISSIHFLNPSDAPNTDGLDIDSSRGIRVNNCRFHVGDDCLCIKSGMDEDGLKQGRPSTDVTVKNCLMKNGHGAVVLGSETSGGISNVKIRNCRFTGTDRGIRVKTRRGRGGTVENIDIRKIRMDGVATPLVLNMYYRCGSDPEDIAGLADTAPRPRNRTTPVIRNIRIRNIRARGVTSSTAFLLGLPESRISGLDIKALRIEALFPDERPDPAMDFFHSPSGGPAILHKNLEDYRIKRVRIQKNKDEIMKELDFTEPFPC